MTTLDYPEQPPRVTDDAEIIATLTRKGWTVRPAPPSYNTQTHQCTWDGAHWIVSVLPPPPVPEVVYAYQLRRALREASKLAAMKAYVAALPDGDEKDFWQSAHEIKRRSRYMAGMRVAIGMNNAQMDTAFFTAANYDT